MKAEQRARFEKLLVEHGWIKGVTWYHPRCRGANAGVSNANPPRAWTFEEAISIDRFGCWSRDRAEIEIIERIEEHDKEEAAKPRLILPSS